MKNKTIAKKTQELEVLPVEADSIPVVNVFQDCNIQTNTGNANSNCIINGYGGSYLTDLHVSILVEQLKKKDEIINQLLKLVKELCDKK